VGPEVAQSCCPKAGFVEVPCLLMELQILTRVVSNEKCPLPSKIATMRAMSNLKALLQVHTANNLLLPTDVSMSTTKCSML
jgi:hypothetical protein